MQLELIGPDFTHHAHCHDNSCYRVEIIAVDNCKNVFIDRVAGRYYIQGDVMFVRVHVFVCFSAPTEGSL